MTFIDRSIRALGLKKAAAEDHARVATFSVEQIVTAGFAGILQRPVDSAAMAGYRGHLNAHPEAVSVFLSELLRSSESASRNGAMLLRGGQPLPATLVSLGTHCFTSDFLRRQGLKNWSGPFDWIFSSIPMVAHCIADDFAMLLDPLFYRPTAVDERPDGAAFNLAHHAYYRTRFGVEHVFNHRDPTQPADYAYLQRCVDRFRQALRSPDEHLFVLHQRYSDQALADLRQLSRVLQQIGCGHRMIALLVDTSSGDSLIPRSQTIHHDAHLIAHRFNPVSTWQPLHFEDPIDEAALARLIRSGCRPAREGQGLS